jgi:hypothetical protein
VSEKNKVLKKIFGVETEEGTGGCRKLYHEELCDVYCSPSIIRAMKSKMVRCPYSSWINLNKRGHLEDLGVDVILKCFLRK